MERIVKGEPGEEGMYWLNQINVPRSVLNLIVLDSLNLTEEQQTRYVTFDGEKRKVVAIPLIDLGFKDEERVHTAVLSAMGYGEEDLPIVAA